jgi:mono/diheme cytochrome c family protein
MIGGHLTIEISVESLPPLTFDIMTRPRLILYLAGLTAGLTLTSFGADAPPAQAPGAGKLPPPADKKGVTYAADVKPILDKSCATCHGADRPKGRLRLDNLEGILQGGGSGKAIIPGDSAKSLLVLNVGHAGDPRAYMPPPNNRANIQPLTTEQVALLRAWVDQGAK